MASLSSDGPNGRLRITFDLDGKRRTLRLGKVSKKVGQAVKLKVEGLLACRIARLPIDTETARWLGDIGDDLHSKLSAAGLVEDRQSEALGAFLAGYLKGREADAKSSTMVGIDVAARDAIAALGADTPLREIDERRADGYRLHLLTRTPKLMPSTASRRLKWVHGFFRHALKLKLIADNPFAGLSSPCTYDESSRVYVPAEDARKAIAGADPVFGLMMALTRFAGLRCPSEVVMLRWDAVDFEAGRMAVHVPKLEHLPGKGTRVVPIFPAVRPYLERAFAERLPGAVYVVAADDIRALAARPGGWTNVSLAEKAAGIIGRAGLTPWPRPLHNLRGSCETDLMAEGHSLHTVCAWIGNSPAVAIKHYLSVRKDDFDKAVGTPEDASRARTLAGWQPLDEPSGLPSGCPNSAASDCHGVGNHPAGTEGGTPVARNPARTGAASEGRGWTPSPQGVDAVGVGPAGSVEVRPSPSSVSVPDGLLTGADGVAGGRRHGEAPGGGAVVAGLTPDRRL